MAGKVGCLSLQMTLDVQRDARAAAIKRLGAGYRQESFAKIADPYVATGPAPGRLRPGAHPPLVLEKRYVQIAALAPTRTRRCT